MSGKAVEKLLVETMARRGCDRAEASNWLNENAPQEFDAAFREDAESHRKILEELAQGRS